MFEHPKIVKLSDGAFRLHLSGIGYCNRYLTDGIIHADLVSRLIPKFRRAYLDELLGNTNGSASPLWLQHADAYEIRDYLDWNSSRAEIQAKQNRISKARSEAGQRGAEARWGHRGR